MKILCAFCDKEILSGDDNEGPNEIISHGVCQPCFNHIKATMGVDLYEYLDMLDYPVLLVDDDVTVLAANTKAKAFVGKDIVKIAGNKGGEVFECIHAKEPGGCGKTVHCSGCTIRNSVTETFKTGNIINKKSATICQEIDGITQTIELLISTRKEGDVVILKVEYV